MNDQLFLHYIDTYLLPVLGRRPTLFALDLMGSHKTPAVHEKLPLHNITPSLIPSNCTSLVQPLDISVNKTFKQIMSGLTNTAIFEAESTEDFHGWRVGDRCILSTTFVGDVYDRFHLKKCDLIGHVFRKVGLSLLVDGSCDSELDIKGFRGLEIGDWHNDYQVVDANKLVEPDLHEDRRPCSFREQPIMLRPVHFLHEQLQSLINYYHPRFLQVLKILSHSRGCHTGILTTHDRSLAHKKEIQISLYSPDVARTPASGSPRISARSTIISPTIVVRTTIIIRSTIFSTSLPG